MRIREAFVPAEGHRLLSADYSQVELRILAHYSGDRRFVEAFARSADIHTATASEVAGIPPAEVSRGQRDPAKTVNFGIIYGLSAFGLSEKLGIPPAEAQATLSTPTSPATAGCAAGSSTRTILRARAEEGYVTTLLGRRRYPLPAFASRNRVLRQDGGAHGGEQRDPGHRGGPDEEGHGGRRRGTPTRAGLGPPA